MFPVTVQPEPLIFTYHGKGGFSTPLHLYSHKLKGSIIEKSTEVSGEKSENS